MAASARPRKQRVPESAGTFPTHGPREWPSGSARGAAGPHLLEAAEHLHRRASRGRDQARRPSRAGLLVRGRATWPDRHGRTHPGPARFPAGEPLAREPLGRARRSRRTPARSRARTGVPACRACRAMGWRRRPSPPGWLTRPVGRSPVPTRRSRPPAGRCRHRKSGTVSPLWVVDSRRTATDHPATSGKCSPFPPVPLCPGVRRRTVVGG